MKNLKKLTFQTEEEINNLLEELDIDAKQIISIIETGGTNVAWCLVNKQVKQIIMDYRKTANKIVNKHFPQKHRVLSWLSAMELLLEQMATGKLEALELEEFLTNRNK